MSLEHNQLLHCTNHRCNACLLILVYTVICIYGVCMRVSVILQRVWVKFPVSGVSRTIATTQRAYQQKLLERVIKASAYVPNYTPDTVSVERLPRPLGAYV